GQSLWWLHPRPVPCGPAGGDRSGTQGTRDVPQAQCAKPLRPRISNAQYEDRSRPRQKDRGIRGDAEARRNHPPERQVQMTRYAAFLRGVNLGKRTVKSAELKAAFEALGYENVKTLLASGNVLFDANGTKGLKEKIEAGLKEQFK